MSQIKRPRRNIRQHTRESDGSAESGDDTSTVVSVLEETKLIQRLRKKPNGVSIEDLAAIKAKPTEIKNKDNLKLKTGGFVDIKALKREISQAEDIEQIGTSFAVETNRRDEDADMVKYVEEELAKRKGRKLDEEVEEEKPKNPEDELFELPSHMMTTKKKTEDMLSNQMLSGIPEVDLGIEVKIRNIEATEEAKQRLLKERMNQKDKGISAFVPTNMAVNFVQHNRFNIEDNTQPIKRAIPTPRPTPLRVGDADRPNTLQDEAAAVSQEKATDDFHFEKFKRHTRRF